MTIYLVKGHTGEYDCTHEWIAKAFSNATEAYNYCEQLNALANKTHPDCFGDQPHTEVFQAQSKIEEELRLLDPKASVDYTGALYRVEELEVE